MHFTKRLQTSIALAAFAIFSASAFGASLADSVIQHPVTSRPSSAAGKVLAESHQLWSETLTRYIGMDYGALDSLDPVLENSDVALVGTLVGIVEGRRTSFHTECLQTRSGRSDVKCAESSDAPSSRRYANLVIKPERVLQGDVEPKQNIHIEHPWPINAPLDDLKSLAPLGQRALIIGDASFPGHAASNLTQALPANVATRNLVRVGPYGLVVESKDGNAFFPLMDARTTSAVFALQEEPSFDTIVSSASAVAAH